MRYLMITTVPRDALIRTIKIHIDHFSNEFRNVRGIAGLPAAGTISDNSI